jgi:hypothetical protein
MTPMPMEIIPPILIVISRRMSSMSRRHNANSALTSARKETLPFFSLVPSQNMIQICRERPRGCNRRNVNRWE